MLDDRKQRILQAIIDDYIESGEPVGSKKVAQKYGIGLSSATIRNEMTTLEEQGYITQPHTSAGRIPSERAFRLYVDELLSDRGINPDDQNLVNHILHKDETSVNNLLQKISLILSKASGYTVFGCEHKKGIILRAVKIFKIENQAAAIMIIDSNENVYTEIIRVENVETEMCNRLSEYLTNKYTGKPMQDLENETFNDLEYRDIIKDQVFLKVLCAIKDMEIKSLLPNIYIEGVTNILDYPEFSDVLAIKNVMNLLNNKKALLSILLSNLNGSINIKIGSENTLKGYENISIVSTTWKLGDGLGANIGIIGPIRMEYGRVIGIMSYLRDRMSNN